VKKEPPPCAKERAEVVAASEVAEESRPCSALVASTMSECLKSCDIVEQYGVGQTRVDFFCRAGGFFHPTRV